MTDSPADDRKGMRRETRRTAGEGWHTRLVAESETGPSVESVFALLRQCLPSVSIERLAVKYPADDDNLWFIKTGSGREVQIGSHPGGRPPFLVEGDLPGQRHWTSEVTEAVDLIVAWLCK